MIDVDRVSGRELDALVAERVLGAKLDESQRGADGCPMILQEVPRYSENPALARGTEFSLEQRHPGSSLAYVSRSPFTVVIRGPSGTDYTATDGSEATAICRAMLKAMGGEGPGLPRDQVQPSRSPRAISAIADLLSVKAAPHQSAGLMMQAVALKEGAHKEAPARVLIQYIGPLNEIAGIIAEQVAGPDSNVALMCVAMLERLLMAGDVSRLALQEAQRHPNPEIATAAARALKATQ
ncbi:MAG TPA: hypothetical protein VFZ65_15530 [Planctomycetota bacterium]|nr:hypothetical protein [Planctomycetota bacterium]